MYDLIHYVERRKSSIFFSTLALQLISNLCAIDLSAVELHIDTKWIFLSKNSIVYKIQLFAFNFRL